MILDLKTKIKRIMDVSSLHESYYTITNIFDYNKCIQARNDSYNNPYYLNIGPPIFYGMSYTLRKYASTSGPLRLSMEHGAFFSNFDPVSAGEYNHSVLLTSSMERVHILDGKIKDYVIPIGPYIYYANCIYDEFNLHAIKRNLGKTLLVFPMHSIEGKSIEGDRDRFSDYVESIKKKYDYQTVLACLYFVDIENGADIYYKRRGWEILCAGRRCNYDFMHLMKTIIMIADHVINQGFSTNVGWSIYLGKPVTIYEDSHYSKYDNRFDKTKVNEAEIINKSYSGLYDDKIVTLLGDYSETISQEVWDYFSYHYGYDYVRSKEEIKLICDFAKEVYKKKGNWEKVLNKEKYRTLLTEKND